MRKIGLLLLAVVVCLSLSSCIYSSANLLRAQGKEINVLGAWGWVKCVDSSVTLYRSTDAIKYIKGNDKYPKVPARPSIQEESEASSMNIGKPSALVPKPATPHENSTPIIAQVAQAVMTK